MNLASRLQQIAEPGEILINETTARLVQGYMRLEALAAVEVKGKTEPVSMYKVIGTLPRRSPVVSRVERTLSQFVGREREPATLEEIFAQVESGHGQVVGVVAEAGGGKSRLLYEFRHRLQDKRVTYLDQARQRSQEALALAQELSHPYSVATALFFTAWLHYARREVHATQELSEAVRTLSAEYEFPFWLSAGTMLRGWALAMQAQIEEGRKQIPQGIASSRATGAEQWRPCALALLAEVYEKAAQSEEGLTVLAEALTLVDKNDERWYEAELHRLQGELLLQQFPDNHLEAESSFQKAIDVSRHQQAKSLELRATTSRARSWQRQGKRQEAYDLLAPVYGWFTEGFDTADLKDAKALLDELAEEIPREA
jgi:predicted ATPase